MDHSKILSDFQMISDIFNQYLQNNFFKKWSRNEKIDHFYGVLLLYEIQIKTQWQQQTTD